VTDAGVKGFKQAHPKCQVSISKIPRMTIPRK
jgi:hypothetical protein